MIEPQDLLVKSLGPSRIDSPLAARLNGRGPTMHNVDECDRVLFDDKVSVIARAPGGVENLPAFEPAGPRKKIFFDPSKTRAAIVTCGGLCPGINDVIRGAGNGALVSLRRSANSWLLERLSGLCRSLRPERFGSTPDVVSDINDAGGTVLGTSRGQQDAVEVVDCLERMCINILFIIGGDGTIRGALNIAAEIASRGEKIGVVGIPKTIDNDIMYIDHSFGFQTAFSEAAKVIRLAHVEARSSPNGVGLVKLMGRQSGFIACYASLPINDADFVLIPEVPFVWTASAGCSAALRKRLEQRGHAVIVVAEGAGQDLAARPQSDRCVRKSADARHRPAVEAPDYGRFREPWAELNLKYIDPSYTIRSVPANAYDSGYCIRLAHSAVHAAMCGRTEMLVGRWHGRFVHVPMELAIRERNTVDPHGDLWDAVLESPVSRVRSNRVLKI